MSFPRYPKYKDSGVEWLGEVPEHWEVRPNKAIMHLRKREVGAAWSETPLLSLTLRGVVLRNIDSGEGKYPSDFSGYQIVEPQDLVFCLFDMDETPRTVGLSDHYGMITAAYDVFQCKSAVSASFVNYFYLHVDAHKHLRPFYTGLRKTVRTPTFLSIKLPFPPSEEQTAIAAFLDRETAKIDALIAEQQRLIELLQEKRQAVISHAVTKGLNPDAPMKESGIEWLGEVPEHWEVWKVSQAFSVIGSGTTPRSGSPEYYENGVIPWVNTGDLNDGRLLDCPKRLTVKALDDHTSLRLYPPESLLFAMYGATIGKLALLGFEATVNQACCVLGAGTAVETPFMFYWLLGMRSNILSLATGGGQPNVSQDIVRSLRVACPDAAEQLRIVAFLDAKTANLELLQTECRNAITLLQERRSALISAAVTGQIDVRGLAGSEAA